MPYTMNLPYTRFVRQVSGENKTITGWKSEMNRTFEALKSATWLQSQIVNNLVGMPLNTPLTFTPSHEYDCFKMSSTVAASGKQICHMGMVAYRFTVPAEANTNNKRITSISLNLGSDKFCVKGLKAVAYFSDTATPPTDWTICRTGDAATPDITTGTVTHGVLPSLEATLALSQNKNADYTLTVTQSTDYAYLYIILTNWDYEDFRTTREYYIEGSGLLEGAVAEFTFDTTSVTPDATSSANTGYQFNTVSFTMADLTGVGLTEAQAIAQLRLRTPLFPGAYNTMADATVDVKIGAHLVGSSTYQGYLGGAIMRTYIKTNRIPYKALEFGSTFAIDLTSKDFSIICNLWVAPPLVVTNDYVDYDTIDATNDASVFAQLCFGTGSLTLKIVKSGVTTPTLAMTNVGQFFLEKGKAYTNISSFPINLSNTNGNILTGILTMMPYEIGTISTTSYASALLDCPIYLS